MSEQFEISATTASTVVVTTVGTYLVLIVPVRVMGSRVLTGTSRFALVCVVAFGAILGRTVLLADPTLAIGVVALTTFFAMQALLGLLRQSPALYRWLNYPLVLLTGCWPEASAKPTRSAASFRRLPDSHGRPYRTCREGVLSDCE